MNKKIVSILLVLILLISGVLQASVFACGERDNEMTGVTFYEHINYNGYKVTLPLGEYTMNQLRASGIKNDDISSLKVPEGMQAIVYEHDNFKGKTFVLTSDNSNLIDICFNDKMSSVKILKTTGVTFYEHINYNGYKVTLPLGEYTMDQLRASGIKNDDISSLKVPEGMQAIVYEHDDFKGKTFVFTSDNSNFIDICFNDKMSSVKIYQKSNLTDSQIEMKLKMFNAEKKSESTTIAPRYRLENTGTEAVKLSDVKIRYYFTIDTEKAMNFWCDWSNIGASNITGRFAKLKTAQPNTDYYYELGFTDGAGVINSGKTIEMHTRISKSDWSSLSQSNDYSFNSSAVDYVDWNKAVILLGGKLMAGESPNKIKSINLNQTALSLNIGGSSKLTAVISPSDADYAGINWTSSNTGVASVNQDGTVTAKGPGAAQITATDKTSGVSAKCSVTVNSQSTQPGGGQSLTAIINDKAIGNVTLETTGFYGDVYEVMSALNGLIEPVLGNSGYQMARLWNTAAGCYYYIEYRSASGAQEGQTYNAYVYKKYDLIDIGAGVGQVGKFSEPVEDSNGATYAIMRNGIINVNIEFLANICGTYSITKTSNSIVVSNHPTAVINGKVISNVTSENKEFYGVAYEVLSALNGLLEPVSGNYNNQMARLWNTTAGCYYYIDYNMAEAEEGVSRTAYVYKEYSYNDIPGVGLVGVFSNPVLDSNGNSVVTYGVMRNGFVNVDIEFLANMGGAYITKNGTCIVVNSPPPATGDIQRPLSIDDFISDPGYTQTGSKKTPLYLRDQYGDLVYSGTERIQIGYWEIKKVNDYMFVFQAKKAVTIDGIGVVGYTPVSQVYLTIYQDPIYTLEEDDKYSYKMGDGFKPQNTFAFAYPYDDIVLDLDYIYGNLSGVGFKVWIVTTNNLTHFKIPKSNLNI